MKRLLALVVLSVPAILRAQDDLPRRGELGAAWRSPGADTPWVEITRVEDGSPAAAAGLRVGDRVRSIDGRPLATEIDLDRETWAMRAGRAVRLGVERAGTRSEVAVTPAAVPREKLPGVEIEYGSVASGGKRLRTIVTRPSGGSGKLPALLLAGWLSCDPVESATGADGFAKVLHGIATRSGFVFLRVDKPGVGDSEGVCSETDFTTELAGYRAALQALRARPDVDPERIFVFGMSNGGGYAPLVADGGRVAGYVVTGGWVKTWFEHMMEFERRRFALAGEAPGAVSAKMKKVAELYDHYLIGRRTPGDVLKARPDLADAWSEPPGHQYGRPAAFYQQLQELNLADAWSKVDAPVLAVHGEHDWIMTPDDAATIVRIVNARKPGRARFHLVPKMDHGFLRHATPEQSFARKPPGTFASEAVDVMVEWLRKTAGLKPQR